MRVTNEQLKLSIESVDKRVLNIESILMARPNSNGKALNTTTVFLVKWVVFPMIVIVGSVVGVSIAIPGG